jgi:hypothetical protein
MSKPKGCLDQRKFNPFGFQAGFSLGSAGVPENKFGAPTGRWRHANGGPEVLKLVFEPVSIGADPVMSIGDRQCVAKGFRDLPLNVRGEAKCRSSPRIVP